MITHKTIHRGSEKQKQQNCDLGKYELGLSLCSDSGLPSDEKQKERTAT